MEPFCYLSPFCIFLQISLYVCGAILLFNSTLVEMYFTVRPLYGAHQRDAMSVVSLHFSLLQELKISLHVRGALFQYHTDQCLWSCTLLCCEWVLCIGESNCLLLLWYFTALQLCPDMLYVCGAILIQYSWWFIDTEVAMCWYCCWMENARYVYMSFASFSFLC